MVLLMLLELGHLPLQVRDHTRIQLTATAPCTIDATAVIVVTEQAAPDAGTDGTLTICEGTIVTEAQLFAALNGTPDAAGTWSPALAGAGPYTYTVAATAPCTIDATAVIVVTEQAAPDAGTDGTLTICEGTIVTEAQLFAALNGTPDAVGTWSPALAGAGPYTYTVAATAPCTIDATAVIVVTEQAAPDAGTDGTLTICEGTIVTEVQLFAALNGTPDAAGTWSPALAGAGPYTYTVAATAPCTTDATAVIVVTEQAAPDAGTDGTLTICEGTIVTEAQLFAALNGTPDAAGTWSPALAGAGPYTYTVAATAPCTIDATAVIVVTEQAAPDAGTDGTLTICEGTIVTEAQLFAALNGTPDAVGTWSPALAGAGPYTYTVAATAPCTTDATAVIVVTEQAAPDAGTDGTLTICEGTIVTEAQLFAALNGTPDAAGTWSPALAGAGPYTYTVAATAPCTTDATAVIVVTEQAAPDAGTDGTLTICEGTIVTEAQLFAALNGTPDAVGTWSPALAGAGTYTYTVTATAPCTIDATAQIVVSEQAAPDAGTNGALTICEASTVTTAELFAQLGGTPDAGGSWTPALAGAGTYTYTVSATAPCTIAATAQIVVSEQLIPANPTVTVTQQPSCSLPFGVIEITSPVGANLEYSIDGVNFQAATTFSNVSSGTFDVMVSVSGIGCPSGSVTVTVDPVPTSPAVPSVSADTMYCDGDALTDLWVSGGAGTFTWYADPALTVVLGTGSTIPVINQLGLTTYFVTETVNDCISEPALTNVMIDPCDTITTIVVPTAFTPDGDYVNDQWDILYLDDLYPDNQVFVYNRWGNMVFESVKGDYSSNKWDGSYNNEDLPVGSFYYMIYTNNAEGEIFKGIVSIIRKE
jgi:gliding motility-associated-like protein